MAAIKMRLFAAYRQSELVVPRVWRAERALERMRGLLGRPALVQGEALLIDPCSSVHTVGMRYALDVVFIGSGERIVKLCRAVAPLRMAFAWGARATLELKAGEIDRLGLTVGDHLEWRPA